MTRTQWLELTTSALLDLDQELRALLRQHTHGPLNLGRQLATREANGPGPGGIKVSTWQARMLLRGAVPPLPQHKPLRRAHARLHLALGAFLDRMPAMSVDPADSQAIELGAELAAVLATWLRAARWQEATLAAGARWRAPDAIMSITRPQTAPAPSTEPEHDARQLVLPLAA